MPQSPGDSNPGHFVSVLQPQDTEVSRIFTRPEVSLDQSQQPRLVQHFYHLAGIEDELPQSFAVQIINHFTSFF